jgi:hypothetical protein
MQYEITTILQTLIFISIFGMPRRSDAIYVSLIQHFYVQYVPHIPSKRVYPITLHIHKLVQIKRANILAKQISNSLYNAT